MFAHYIRAFFSADSFHLLCCITPCESSGRFFGPSDNSMFAREYISVFARPRYAKFSARRPPTCCPRLRLRPAVAAGRYVLYFRVCSCTTTSCLPIIGQAKATTVDHITVAVLLGRTDRRRADKKIHEFCPRDKDCAGFVRGVRVKRHSWPLTEDQ